MQGIFPVFLKLFTCNHSYKLVDTKYIKWCLIWIDVFFFQIYKKFEKKEKSDNYLGTHWGWCSVNFLISISDKLSANQAYDTRSIYMSNYVDFRIVYVSRFFLPNKNIVYIYSFIMCNWCIIKPQTYHTLNCSIP